MLCLYQESGELSESFKNVMLIFVVCTQLTGKFKQNELLGMVLNFFEGGGGSSDALITN